MNRLVRGRAFAFAILILALTLPGCSRKEDQSKMAAGQGAASAQAKDIWISETTGKLYHVTVDGDTFRAEWVNIPPDLSAKGEYIRTECKKQGDKWVGKSTSYLPCSTSNAANSKIDNWCRLETAIEILSMTPNRITGSGESIKQFDCAKCQIVEHGTKDFFWTPKK